MYFGDDGRIPVEVHQGILQFVKPNVSKEAFLSLRLVSSYWRNLVDSLPSTEKELLDYIRACLQFALMH